MRRLLEGVTVYAVNGDLLLAAKQLRSELHKRGHNSKADAIPGLFVDTVFLAPGDSRENISKLIRQYCNLEECYEYDI